MKCLLIVLAIKMYLTIVVDYAPLGVLVTVFP